MKTKKFLSLLLVFCMLFSLTCSAFAADEPAPATLASWKGATLTSNGADDVVKGVELTRGEVVKDTELGSFKSVEAVEKYGYAKVNMFYGANHFIAGEQYAYFAFELPTTGYENITVTTKLGGNSRVPLTYVLQWSLDGTAWNAADTPITAAASYDIAKAAVSTVALPAEAADQAKILFRVAQTEAAKPKDGNGTDAGALYIYDLSVTGTPTGGTPTPPPEKSDDIVILYTNDVHCQVEPKLKDGVQVNMGYANVAAYKQAMLEKYSNVTLVDCGDAIQGGPVGAMTKGEAVVTVMNSAGYDIATFGNHEYDYGMPQLKKLVDMAKFDVVACNFAFTGTDPAENVFEDGDYAPYVLRTYGDKTVAFVGIATPESFTKSTPTYFQNEKGEFIYSFAENNNGADLYASVQKAVDAAAAEADYVVAVAHTGTDPDSAPWNSYDVIANTSGIDVYLDGHSHSTIAGEHVADKNGADVLLTSTGTKLKNIGKVVIGADGIRSELVGAGDCTAADAATKGVIDGIMADLNKTLKTVVAHTGFDLTVNYPDSTDRAIRSAETNLGDLCADAYRKLYDADIAFVNGGGIRTSIPKGDITFEQIINVHPFSNEAAVIKVSGRTILDALEMGSRAIPGENGGFLQVSGLRYKVNTAIPSSVQVDDKKTFVSVAGPRRVFDAEILNDDGTYTAIDPNAVYTLAGHNYMLLNGGDGYSMFRMDKNFEQVTTIQPRLDNQVLIDYIQSMPDQTVGAKYQNLTGQGRITVKADAAAAADMLTALLPANPAGYQTPERLGKDVDAARTALCGAETLEEMHAAFGTLHAAVAAVIEDEFNSIMDAIGQRKAYTEETAAAVDAVLKAWSGCSEAGDAAAMRDAAEQLKTAVKGLRFVPNTFNDTEPGKWYSDAVDFVQAFGAVAGMPDGSFGLETGATRGMVATILYRLDGEPDVSKLDCPFTDVPEGRYFSDAVKWAYSEGIFSGKTETVFEPDTVITRQEMAAVLIRMMGFNADSFTAEEKAELLATLNKTYTDAASIYNYAKLPVALCGAAKLMVGNTDGTFGPQNPLTRAQFARVLFNVFSLSLKTLVQPYQAPEAPPAALPVPALAA